MYTRNGPLTQRQFDEYLIDKYGDLNRIYDEIHHYETTEVTNSKGIVIVPEGMHVEADYSIQFYDSDTERYTIEYPVVPVTNYDYESKIENEKRGIYLLKTSYVNIAKDDLEEMMTYKKGFHSICKWNPEVCRKYSIISINHSSASF